MIFLPHVFWPCAQGNLPLPVFAGTLSLILSRAVSEASRALPYSLVPALDLANHSLSPGCTCAAWRAWGPTVTLLAPPGGPIFACSKPGARRYGGLSR